MAALSFIYRAPLLLALVAAAGLVRAQSPSVQPPAPAPPSLFAQSMAKILRRDFPHNGASYLLLDARSGEVLARRWEDLDQPIPLGSLVKPFTALAYASAHEFHYPRYQCLGTAGHCWQARPHGDLELVSAISFSCNAYFRRMAEEVSAEQLAPVTREFGLESPENNFASTALAGLGSQWLISPRHMARAYLELYRRKQQPGVSEILLGLKDSALHGTGIGVGRQLAHTAALVKTGTAPCTHTPWAPADGFAIVLLPADDPQILLMVRVHSVTGASAAGAAGLVLRETEQ